MAKRLEIDEIVEEMYPDSHEILLLEPRDLYDEALIGIAERFEEHGHVPFAVYDEDKLIDIIAESFDDEDLDEDDDRYTMAREHFDFNIQGSYVGIGTPAFVRVL